MGWHIFLHDLCSLSAFTVKVIFLDVGNSYICVLCAEDVAPVIVYFASLFDYFMMLNQQLKPCRIEFNVWGWLLVMHVVENGHGYGVKAI